MTISTAAATSDRLLPTRFRAAEARNARIARPLRLAGRVRHVDEDLLERIRIGFGHRDEPGADLAEAMRRRGDDPERVTMAQFRTALAEGVDAVPDAPQALRRFLEVVEADPPWLDRELMERGAEVGRSLGRNAADVLLQLSLIGGYRFGGPPDLLVATGGLTGDSTRRRLAETQAWTTAMTMPDQLSGGSSQRSEAWRTTVHVRAMHALVNASFAERWDVERWGLPINQSDQGATLGLFDGTLLIGARALGVPISAEDSRAVMHLWRYVGWLLGVDEQWLVETERERHAMNYHVVLAQGGPTQAGARLAQDLLATIGTLPHGRWKQERTLSMLTVFLGRSSMRELGLPVRLPWAHVYLWVLNTWRYRVLGRLPGGRERLLAWGDRVVERLHGEYFRDEQRGVADLPR